MNEQLPAEIQITRARSVPKSKKSLASQLDTAVYRIYLEPVPADGTVSGESQRDDSVERWSEQLAKTIENLLASESLIVGGETDAPPDGQRQQSGEETGDKTGDQTGERPATEKTGEKPVKRRDIRPGILAIGLSSQTRQNGNESKSSGRDESSYGEAITLEVRLAHSPSLHVKPGDLLSVLQYRLPELSQSFRTRVVRIEMNAAGGSEIFSL